MNVRYRVELSQSERADLATLLSGKDEALLVAPAGGHGLYQAAG